MIIKIGRDDIEVKKGDYITFDGEKYTLLSGEYPQIIQPLPPLCLWV
jgi:hypothetical protein